MPRPRCLDLCRKFNIAALISCGFVGSSFELGGELASPVTGEVKFTDELPRLNTYMSPEVWVNTELRILECGIRKDGSGTMQRLLNAAFVPGHKDVKTVQCPIDNHPENPCQLYLRDPTWLKVAVVREPVERFVSAFLDKCARPEGPRGPCELWRFPSVMDAATCAEANLPYPLTREHISLIIGNMHAHNAVQSAMEERGIAAMFREYVLDTVEDLRGSLRCKINHHFAPQACFCGLENPEIFGRFLLLSLHKLNAQYLEQTIIPKLPDRPPEAIEAFIRAAETVFAKNNTQKATDAGTHVDWMVTPELVEAIHEGYAMDYDLLRFVWET